MRFNPLQAVRFIEKKNRFVGIIEVEGIHHRCYIPNTGRLGELLFEGNRVYVDYEEKEHRKTAYTLRLTEKEGRLISIDSHIPNGLVVEAIRKGLLPIDPKVTIQREVTVLNSRFDLYLPEENHLIEVKGVTLEKDGVAAFPDAPTIRGTKHVRELIEARDLGYKCSVVFLVQFDFARVFRPNGSMDPAFARALTDAAKAGVNLYAVGCHVDLETIEPTYTLPIDLEVSGDE